MRLMNIEEVTENALHGCPVPMITFVHTRKSKNSPQGGFTDSGLCTSDWNYVADWLTKDNARPGYGRNWWAFALDDFDRDALQALFKTE